VSNFSVCSHLAGAGSMAQPLAAIGTGFFCASCAAECCNDLMAQGTGPATVAASLNFTKCGHSSPGAICNPCRTGCTAFVQLLAAVAHFQDSETSNRLKRVSAALDSIHRERLIARGVQPKY